MKNLKVGQSAASLVAIGIAFTFVSCVGYGFTSTDVDTAYAKQELNSYFNSSSYTNIEKNSVYAYEDFLFNNDLIPLSVAKKVVEKDRINGKYFVEKLTSDDETDELYWKKITKEEMINYTGILRLSDSVDFNLYEVVLENNNFVKNKVSEHVSTGNYFVDLNDLYELDDPIEYYYFEGVRKNLVRK